MLFENEEELNEFADNSYDEIEIVEQDETIESDSSDDIEILSDDELENTDGGAGYTSVGGAIGGSFTQIRANWDGIHIPKGKTVTFFCNGIDYVVLGYTSGIDIMKYYGSNGLGFAVTNNGLKRHARATIRYKEVNRRTKKSLIDQFYVEG